MNEQSEKLLQKKLLINNLMKNTNINSNNSFITSGFETYNSNNNINFQHDEFSKLKALKEKMKSKTLSDINNESSKKSETSSKKNTIIKLNQYQYGKSVKYNRNDQYDHSGNSQDSNKLNQLKDNCSNDQYKRNSSNKDKELENFKRIKYNNHLYT